MLQSPLPTYPRGETFPGIWVALVAYVATLTPVSPCSGGHVADLRVDRAVLSASERTLSSLKREFEGAPGFGAFDRFTNRYTTREVGSL